MSIAEPQTTTEARTLKNFAGGAWVPANTAETLASRDPATGNLLSRVPLSGASDVDAAVTAARTAQRKWAHVAPQIRARALYRLRDVLDQHRNELAAIVTRDLGKTFDDAYAEVGRGIESVESAMGGPHLLKGQVLDDIARGVDIEMVRQPVGVVAAITPFNFPAMIPLWFLPYAIVCGNAFLLKPSEQDPLVSERIFELIDTVEELPKGLLALVHGGRDAVNAILEHPGVDAVSFVGSAKTARYIKTKGSEHGKRVQALGGAKNSMVVMPDADPALVQSVVTSSAFGAAGQRCLSGSVAVLVGTSEEQDHARALILEASTALLTGPGTDPRTDVCPVVTSTARERLIDDIAKAERDGISVLLDGRGVQGAGSATIGPTILDDIPDGHRVLEEELFGPILSLKRVPDFEAALGFVNSSRYGNSSTLLTESGGTAREYRQRAEVGMIGVNIGVPAPIAWFPFTGWKDSIEGDLHANGSDAVEFYTRKKVVTSRWATK